MAIFGVSCGAHDAAISVVSGKKILFAASSDRYSKEKGDRYLNDAIVREALEWGDVDTLVYYEKPFLKKLRYWHSGYKDDFNHKEHLRKFFGKIPIVTVSHHESHAAAGYFTSGFTDAAVIVADNVGEWNSLSVWVAIGGELKKVWSTSYPHSLGRLYSAFTARCGLNQEHITMGASAFGNTDLASKIREEFMESGKFRHEFILKKNSLNKLEEWMRLSSPEDIAASIQKLLEECLVDLFEWVALSTRKRYLVFMGGVALNSVANAKLCTRKIFDDIWIMPNPGNSGSALGAALAYKRAHINWNGPYLGTEIKRPLDIDEIVENLERGEVVGVANGRAEFSPHALGNRSILADPRHRNMREKVNGIKGRQKFRPFSASVLEETAHEHFVMPENLTQSPYMEYSWRVKYPRYVPSICHINSTTRLQTVNYEQNSGFYDILRRWQEKTGCPMLLNTSFNLAGMPSVNTWEDVMNFRWMHDIPIF